MLTHFNPTYSHMSQGTDRRDRERERERERDREREREERESEKERERVLWVCDCSIMHLSICPMCQTIP
jgi:hypothetical protein